jgi:glycosyltransferase involved in cell wall biosynthesis
MPAKYSQTAALIPAYNDDYSLYLCLQSVAPFFDEVWVNDDRSTDRTDKVIEQARSEFHNIKVHRSDVQMGWVKSIEKLFSLSDARHVFRIDADDIMYPQAAEALDRMVRDERACYLLGLWECWGDFHHSRRDLGVNWDSTHLYVDRARCDIVWKEGPPPTNWPRAEISAKKHKWPESLFFHAPGVKSDQRIVLRLMINRWESAGRPCPLEEWPPYRKRSALNEHQEALQYLLYVRDQPRELIQIPSEFIPAVCLANERFELIKNEQGVAVDRADHGWVFDA